MAALAIAAGMTAPARAQGNGCILDNCEDRRPPQPSRSSLGDPQRGGYDRARPRGASRAGDFDFYVLSLSWSPGFCATGGDAKGRDQCRRGADIGFTVHGLWPQYAHGFPSDCRGQTNPPRAALATTDGVYPDEGLARYEWRRHGTCSGLDPFAYFAAVRRARAAIVIPPALKEPHADQAVSPAAIAHAFGDSNPGLRPDMLAAICRDGTLDEVRICFTKDLGAFQACPQVVHEGCDRSSVSVPAVR